MSKLPVWGDGFAADNLDALAGVTSWDEVTSDEYVLYFPRLARHDRDVPQNLTARLTTIVSARAGMSSHRLDGAQGLLARINGVFGGPAKRLPDVAANRNIPALLQGLLTDLLAGRTPTYDDDTAALAAFGSGIHPAYFWPEAAVCAGRGVVAGWLGHLNRGRAAFVPEMVAEYLEDTLSGDRLDPLIVELCGGDANRRTLVKAAGRRLRGEDPVVRLSASVRSTASSSLGVGFPKIAAGARA